jgi:hypothetical protein
MVLVPLVAYLHTKLGQFSGISFIDSTSLAVCRNPPIHQHRVFPDEPLVARPRWAGSSTSSST